MECLSEIKLKTEKKDTAEKTNLQSTGSEDNRKKITKAGRKTGKQRIIKVNSPEFAPLKHYLNTLYGFPDSDSPGSKIVCIIEPNEDDYSHLAARAGQNKSEVECWHVHRRCFAWSFSVGTLIILLGLTCLLLGFLMPRHSALVNPMENDEKMMGTKGHFNNRFDSSISAVNMLDRKAIEHNNMLDTLKLSGGMASCFGCLLLLMTFILPPGSHPPKMSDEEEQASTNINQLNEALRNCGF